LEPSDTTSLIGRRLLAKNILWNLTGQVLPMLVGLITIPILIRSLGTERFGILTLIWIVIGYFGVFDFGLGRALTKIVAERLGSDERDSVPAIVMGTLRIALALGVAGAAIVMCIAPWLVTTALNIPGSLMEESLHAFYLLALSIPLVICTVCLRGVLEANQRFDQVNAVRVPLGVFTFLGPLAVAVFSSSLVAIVAVLIVGRILACAAYGWWSSRLIQRPVSTAKLDRRFVRQLFAFGGWMTVTNLVGPLMVYMDRLLIGSVMTMSAVTYYATPYEIVSRLSFIPASIVGVLFPALAYSLAKDPLQASKILQRGLDGIALLILPVLVLLTAYAEPGLRWWVGDEIAQRGSAVLQWLALGVLLNGFAHLTVAQIQAAGRPDLSAKLHLFEFAPYLLCLWWLTRMKGIEGAAMAWTIRAALDLVASGAIVGWLLHETRRALVRTAGVAAVAVATLIGAMWASRQQLSSQYVLAVTPVLVLAAWLTLLQSSDRTRILSWLARSVRA
jgi:O-antigen/teichoic acid export membrane protein